MSQAARQGSGGVVREAARRSVRAALPPKPRSPPTHRQWRLHEEAGEVRGGRGGRLMSGGASREKRGLWRGARGAAPQGLSSRALVLQREEALGGGRVRGAAPSTHPTP